MQSSKALGYLGIARRGNNIVIGEEPVGAACRASHARLLILASDAADHTARRAKSFAVSGKPPIMKTPFDKDTLGNTLGCNACAMAAFTDVSLALEFAKAMDTPDEALIALLQTQTERVKKRRTEEKAYRKNLRQGRKKA